MISKSEYLRKVIHLYNLIIPISYYYLFPEKWEFLTIIIYATLFIILIDIARNFIPFIQSIFSILFNDMLREHELKGKLTGATWVMIGSCITIALFPKAVAILALIFMSIGDTVAGLVGKKFGKHKIGLKSWEGFISGLVFCLVIAVLYNHLPTHVSIIGALSAMIFETLPIPLDDNFKIPIGSGGIMMMFL